MSSGGTLAAWLRPDGKDPLRPRPLAERARAALQVWKVWEQNRGRMRGPKQQTLIRPTPSAFPWPIFWLIFRVTHHLNLFRQAQLNLPIPISSCLVQVAQGMAALHGSSPLIMHRGEEEAGVRRRQGGIGSGILISLAGYVQPHQGEELTAGGQVRQGGM